MLYSPDTSLFYSSIDEIPSKTWKELGCGEHVYFHPNFLKSIEKNHPEIQFSYIILVDENKNPIAFASIQVINFQIDDIKNDLELLIKKLKNLGRKLRVIPNKKPLKLLISGSTFISGEHGIFIKNENNKKIIIKQLAKAILHFANANEKLKIDAFLLKDFKNKSLSIADELKNYNYHPFSVEQNMTFKLDKHWIVFDDYLAAMKTKFRVKAKKAFERSKEIRIEEVTLENIDYQLPQMTTLYQGVVSNANFNLGTFNLSAFKDLKELLGENYIIRSYWLDHKMIGFISGVMNQKSLDAHFVGIDYLLNREHAIYQRMLYNYIEIGINKKLNTINFGRTASEIKSSVGAVPEDLTIYLRHKKGVKNKILKLFLQRIQPNSFQQKFPFKTKKNNEKL
ncbi:MAG: peptidogalycan biosysnthesis protein [Polaribacter sp.]|nr:peptidogalycan biosysnthesis protein [Polaribacter sp.]